ncbi:MAG TPA: tRNA (adenosine(37)-N6)-threonylcarbamoyltransferase complex dimerization subunit type 1 TsaB [Gemmatimonadales bacterium]|nr:tRNA (adenosine(37)-N6)-threonylcarbamoyltransferase complex dimerization subunit type 1 TsaB [Gemmatimonadales bacterium]
MTWLAIDTSGRRAAVALGGPGAVAVHAAVEGPRVHGARLLPLVDDLLARAGLTLGDVTDLALTDGPGSFTGLRVGAAVAKALVRTRGVALHVAPALLAAAAEPLLAGGVVVSASDALRGEVYAGAWALVDRRLDTRLAPRAVAPTRLPGLLPRPAALVAGLPAALAAPLAAWAGEPVAPGDAAVGLLWLAAFPGILRPVPEPDAWEPDYGRPAEAQARWEAAHGRALPDPARLG